MEKKKQITVLNKNKKEDKFSKLSLALKNNLLRRKSTNKSQKEEQAEK